MIITLSEFEESFKDVTFPVAVAVSGGSDSLALLLLAQELAKKRGSYVVALTVDHGLRSESKEEAIQVHKWARKRGIQHVILDWQGEKPSSRLQERARQARYALLVTYCQEHQISTLLLGHHQQDQEETFWLRLISGSGLTGLSGIRKYTLKAGILCVRPLLDFPKERIKETLVAYDQEWIEDPSNNSSRFFRGRLRQFSFDEGLSSSRLNQVIQKLGNDADFIQEVVNKTIHEVIEPHEEGYLTIKKEPFHQLHPAIAQRILSFLMQWFSSSLYAPRTTQIQGILEKLKKEVPFTAGGVYWSFSCETILLSRERRAVAQEIHLSTLSKKTLWDNRFWIEPQLKSYVPEDLSIGSLGPIFNDHTGKQKDKLFFSSRTPLPFYVKTTLPALWLKGKVVAVPHLCYSILECEKDIRKFFYLKPLFHDSLTLTI